MKKTLVILFSVLLTGTGFYGCKKGEGDPMLSLRSRKARVVGDWKVTAAKSTENNDGIIKTTNFNGSTETVVDDGNSYTDQLTMKYTFDKSGTYTYSVLRVHTEIQDDFPLTNWTYTSTTTTNETGTGIWNFTGKIGELKNKSQLNLQWTSSTESVSTVWEQEDNTGATVASGDTSDTYVNTTSGWNYTGVVDLYELKNKEMIWQMNETSNFDGYFYTFTGEQTLTAQ